MGVSVSSLERSVIKLIRRATLIELCTAPVGGETDKDCRTLILQELLPAVTNPRAAVDMAGYASALEEWETITGCLPKLGE